MPNGSQQHKPITPSRSSRYQAPYDPAEIVEEPVDTFIAAARGKMETRNAAKRKKAVPPPSTPKNKQVVANEPAQSSSPLDGGTARKQRRTTDEKAVPLDDSFEPEVTLDASSQKAIDKTFPHKEHRLSDWNFRRVLRSSLPAALRGVLYPYDFGQKGAPMAGRRG